MAYRLNKHDRTILDGLSLLTCGLECYDTLDDDTFAYDRDETLHRRSALELVRDELTPDQQAELDMIDAHWRENADDFNRAFAIWHNQADREAELSGFVEGQKGQQVPIPRSHWWWRPLDAE